MGTILVVAEHLEGKLKAATLNTVAFANAVSAIDGGDVVGLVLGAGAESVAKELAAHCGRVVYVDSPAFKDVLAEAYAPAVADIAKELGATVVAAASTSVGKDYLPRVAATLDGGMISDAIAVFEHDGDVAYKRPVLSGNAIARVKSEADVTCVTVRTTAFEATTGGVSGTVESRSGAATPDNAKFVAFHLVKSDRPELTEASVVVAGGRGLKSAEAFGIIEGLADKLGGAVGASRAAVDSGYAPNDWQVGQTGKIVAPNLYIAVAISGAIQHLAGMKGSKTIVAINKDAEAPIFQVADYGLVADAFNAVPELTSKL
ncbi:MAG: electron transfer flavoprotein subunit alpha/FixB family protein [Myxococcales bacterium]|nr:electron transfer flavoprotein subunit alpha/FixB family protein [Myxococcales bacterium]MCB9519756.1 electron transfer flavoprotein subunit alpha/FixB family protein [Myxococcales bacterium]